MTELPDAPAHHPRRQADPGQANRGGAGQPGVGHGAGGRARPAGLGLSQAAGAREDREQDLGMFHRQMGRKGLENIQNAGPRLVLVADRRVEAPMNR